MKKILSLSIISAFVALNASSTAFAGTVNWTQWNNATTGITSQNGNSITVTYSGETSGVDYSSYIYDVPSSFTNAEVSNTPGSNGTLRMVGGGANRINTFHFSQAVVNPYIDLFSVGQSGVPVAFNFTNATPTILAQGRGHWGGGTLVMNGPNSVLGREGNGLLKFTGTFTDISFITPNYEYYYGATIGLAATAPIPEPETWGMLLTGLGALAFFARRRQQK